jgi:dTDP-4-amino-4,6-dideoxygalactose transaminase
MNGMNWLKTDRCGCLGHWLMMGWSRKLGKISAEGGYASRHRRRLSVQIAFTGLQAQSERLRSAIEARISRVLDHGKFIMGPEVLELETRLGEFCGASEAITVANGTDALQIVLMAAGIGAGDGVLIPSFTFTATAEVVLLLGARPVFVDVEPASFNIDCYDLERRIENELRKGASVKAVIAVDLFGLPADWPRLNDIARRHGLLLIADAAQSFGGALDSKRVGTLAPVTTTSFFPAKPLGCFGDGGAIFTDDPAIAASVRSIRIHGQGAEKYETVRVGVNSRLDTIQAAILLVKLEVLEEEISRRNSIAQKYTNHLADIVGTPVVPSGHRSAWAQYTIKTEHRTVLERALKEAGVPTAVYYPRPMHQQSAYQGYAAGDDSLPVCEMLSGKVLSLPFSAYALDEEVEFICAAVRSGSVAQAST